MLKVLQRSKNFKGYFESFKEDVFAEIEIGRNFHKINGCNNHATEQVCPLAIRWCITCIIHNKISMRKKVPKICRAQPIFIK